MPTVPCSGTDKPIAQTLFLGASVSSFSTNMGWGTQPSQLTVNLIEDELSWLCDPDNVARQNSDGSNYMQFPGSDDTSVGHFDGCAGISCFVDKYTGSNASTTTPVDNRILKGKVYYQLSDTGLQSRYWKRPDPGFIGHKTRIKPDGTVDTPGPTDAAHPNYRYDIIDVPVYFKMGNFTFGGFVQSWSKDTSSGGRRFTVIVNGPQSILNSCMMILNNYGGSIFGKKSTSSTAPSYGAPGNYLLSQGIDFTKTQLHEGAMPNVFNIYGFLESLGYNSYGGAYRNESGISVNSILQALMALTSTTHNSTHKLDTVGTGREAYAIKRAFSPFGRIISKTMQQESPIASIYNTTSCYTFGIVYAQDFLHMVNNNDTRCQFVLDLNDVYWADSNRTIKRFPDSFRINEPSLSITEFLNIIGEQSGNDFNIEMDPITYAGRLYNVIKVKTISRLKQPHPAVIENTIKSLECDGYAISSHSFGKEKNDTPSRCLLVGGQQQRLYQVKSYRLAYSQNNFVMNPRTKEFVNYFSLQNPITETNVNAAPLSPLDLQYGHGKVRFPNFTSTRNKLLNDYIGTSNQLAQSFVQIINDQNEMVITNPFNTEDTNWKTNELNSSIAVNNGNYLNSFKISHSITIPPNGRWIPLFLDTICPFFGFVNDNRIGVKIGTDKDAVNELRQIRPVWFDSWTGQTAVIVRTSELPKLNLPLTRLYLEASPTANAAGNYTFNMPYTFTPTAPAANSVVDNAGFVTAYDPVEYFVLTESEIRAALAGFDNFLVYSLAKTYKPDIIEMVRRAYYISTRNQLQINNPSLAPAEAKKIAYEETDWYWKLLGSNIGGDDLYPTIYHPDKTDGSQYIQEKALQDLKLIHQFITQVAKYYGKKYMVYADSLGGYKDYESAGVAFPTRNGYGYVFAGGGRLKYNYEPTNDGAWEEYGNIIDDAFTVGGLEWMNLSDDQGKIKPILGYNNNYNYDYVRQAKCLAANADTTNELKNVEANPYFSYNNWLTLFESKTTNCTNSYVFPSIDYSSLNSEDYVVIDQKYQASPATVLARMFGDGSTMSTRLGLSLNVSSYDAWNKVINETGVILPRSKLFLSTTVDENFAFLNPQNIVGQNWVPRDPRILIDSPGVNINMTSEENAKDPNRTVIANVAAEDLMIYMKSTQKASWDWGWIGFMYNYISPAVISDTANPYFLGLYTVSSNHTANNVELAPKAAHPFFAGIPIKSNQFTYGPWTNYPLNKCIPGTTGLFPTGFIINQTTADGTLVSCARTNTTAISLDKAKQALNNLITSVDIDFNEEFVPWNYGGMHYMDIAAFNEIEGRANYQSVLETAQLEMPGLPLWDLGGNFNIINANTGVKYLPAEIKDCEVTGKDVKGLATIPSINLNYIPGVQYISYPNSVDGSFDYKYKLIDLRQRPNFVEGPIVTSIQTSVGQQGISCTYTFRTYTRKLGAFNKIETDRIKKINRANLYRGKQIAKVRQDVSDMMNKERENLLQERLNQTQFGSADFASKLYGWSPTTVLIGQASPLIHEPARTPDYIEDFSYANSPTLNTLGTRTNTPKDWKITRSSGDPGLDSNAGNFALSVDKSVPLLKNIGRITTTVGLFERKEVENQLQKDYGMQSAMSLDGLLSPISFYPTFKNSTFAYSLHNTGSCPFCKGTKVRKFKISKYNSSGAPVVDKNINVACDKCTDASNRLNAKLSAGSNETIPINLITLNPIVVPHGEFKNANVQNYSGVHPQKKHDDLTSSAPGGRVFRDRLRHSIEIVGRGSVPPNKQGYALEISKNINKAGTYNLDYYSKDTGLYTQRQKRGDASNTILHENNQRFFGLRGPLVLHSWGYDADGYPVPNAADEPVAVDVYGRPKRFQLIKVNGTSKAYKDLSNGEQFTYNSADYVKTINQEELTFLPSSFTEDTQVTTFEIKDNYNVDGGMDPGADGPFVGYKGSIISKTQKFSGGKWSEKVKLDEFYLNWAERPDLWKVGPIDLFWDEERGVWSGGGEGGAEEIDPPYIITNSNDIITLNEFIAKKTDKKYIYRMIYAVLEEDLIKQPDFNETYVTRGFFDDIEYSSEPLLQGYRRLIYIKDKTGYCAPKGTKLLCRYNAKTGFYEPVSKPVITTTGKIISLNQVLLNLLYTPSRRSNVIPTSTVNYVNPLGFATPTNEIGVFSFIDSQWTLTSIKQ